MTFGPTAFAQGTTPGICVHCGCNLRAHFTNAADIDSERPPRCPTKAEVEGWSNAMLTRNVMPLPRPGDITAWGKAESQARAGELVDVAMTFPGDSQEAKMLKDSGMFSVQEMHMDRSSRQEMMSRTAIVQLREEDILAFFGLGEEFDIVSVWADPSRNVINIKVRADHLPVTKSGAESKTLEGSWDREVHVESGVDANGALVDVQYYRMGWMGEGS